MVSKAPTGLCGLVRRFIALHNTSALLSQPPLHMIVHVAQPAGTLSCIEYELLGDPDHQLPRAGGKLLPHCQGAERRLHPLVDLVAPGRSSSLASGSCAWTMPFLSVSK